MKKQFIILGIVIFLFTNGLSGCIGPTTGIMIWRLDKAPETFINMGEEQIKIFPLLKEAILTNKTVEVSSPSGEIEQLMGVLRYFDTNIIKYHDEYYEIKIFCAD
ncbi:hypothetical protein AYK21_04250 [Thermoplasmatales archaeon SG8-52-2]|nr:MAG: hypothetical protein AYK21_04250 [Thermoplasmatales archaeon SG8-52-2]